MKILVIDDDKALNKGICAFLNNNNINTVSTYDGNDAIQEIRNDNFDLILSDLQMPSLGGMGVLKYISNEGLSVPIIIMTAFASIENAVEALQSGAEDYLTKPINLNELKIKIEKVIESEKIKNENYELKEKVKNIEIPEIIGESEVILEMKNMLRKISNDSDIPISIYGQSGTGKELVARNIHAMSERKNKPFIPINCATLNDDLLESELFGHEKGAFTGATQSKLGIFETCDGGTLFLDEIGEMTPRVQSKLLRVLQDGLIQPLGSNNMRKVNIRIVCASNRKLIDLVENNKFRNDLFYRLNVIEIEVPRLIARRSDIPLLLKSFLKKYNKPEMYFSNEAINSIKNYDWPGNVRELENLVRMLMVTVNSTKINVKDLPPQFNVDNSEIDNEDYIFNTDYKVAFNKSIIDFEKKYLGYHLKKNNFNISKTADIINLSRVSLHKKIKEYGIGVNN